MHFIKLAIFAAFALEIALVAIASDAAKLVITVLSQYPGYHTAKAYRLRDNIKEQAKDLQDVSVNIILTHELNLVGSWTIGNILPDLIRNFEESQWYLFCEVNTFIKLKRLMDLLRGFNSSQVQKDIWLGYAVYDHEPTIIHHFSDHTKKFKYPNPSSGFVITAPLVKKLAQRVASGEKPEGEFSIDAAYEFSKFVWDNGKGTRLIHVPELCVVSDDTCATYPQHFHPCGQSIPIQKVYVAVKTCSKFHVQRISVIKRTWAKHAANIGYYSDKADDNIPEAIVTPNTTQGHCAKTYSILKHSNEILTSKKLDWLVITDDDTILSLGKLLQLLTCYNPSDPVALGERYGFRLWKNSGYNYLTGGAGLVLSANLVQKLIEPGFCSCPSPSTPDDMFLFGVCLKRVGTEPIHLPHFHQARPDDYPKVYLASQEPVSFHKFWQIDPKQVYDEWFAEADAYLSPPVQHTEL
ncbi:beta-1,3-glucosyltransferase isoform X1 [Neodiprion lecontei]|uniref:Beta-1,3-glucosyltransferase isoform X1 n=1 Tax=Neodiprion lecontei TaxID=441921 RepID=A0ABM3GCL8_NEOLC|nr:beta-1,3-glucosyltransferase isoform X1 [Neodiprion lecontei]